MWNCLLCFPCLLFSITKKLFDQVQVLKPYNLWKDAKAHASSRHYKLYFKVYLHLENSDSDGHIETALNEAFAQEVPCHNKLVKSNRAVLLGLIDCVWLLGMQKLASRGDGLSEA